ncbi:hypothetical protein BGZ95_001044 [Linnemannia exigua]|uniref:F-box domain-containing protein n=1 Tax=Linnemannia exigua TaxID=604196 RepID=A0AAD4D7U5_9FUNG|nr:hypothetical protein BGZ95_001044 [Linnemannia exigua]
MTVITTTNNNQLYSDRPQLPSYPHPKSSLHSFPPEILEKIFHNLSQATLRKTVNPVCRQWRFLSNYLIHRTATWKPFPPSTAGASGNKKVKKLNQEKEKERLVEFHERLLEQLESGNVNTFECWVLGDGRGDRNRRDNASNVKVPGLWDEFVLAMQDRLLEAQKWENSEEKDEKEAYDGTGHFYKQDGCRLFESIRTLRIYGNLMDTDKMVKDLQPCLEYLETLEVYIHKGSASPIDIFSILDNAPRLQSLVIDVKHSVPTSSGRQQKRSYYSLKQLILNGPYISVFAAEQVIKSCPKLRVLKTLKVSTNGYLDGFPRWNVSILQEASERLSRLARDHCSNLQWYQGDLQYSNRLPTQTRLIEMIRTFPEKRMQQHLSIMPYEDPLSDRFEPELQPVAPLAPFLPALHRLLDRLTVLEIGPRSSSLYLINWHTVNRIICLCSPFLQTLLAPDISIMTHDLVGSRLRQDDDGFYFFPDWFFGTEREQRRRDCVERRLLQNSVLSSSPDEHERVYYCPYPGIWPCRHFLRTLQCELYWYSIDAFAAWTQHIRAYRLFGQLTSLRVDCQEFRVGQLSPSSVTKKKNHNKHGSSSLSAALPERRYPNDLLALKSLVYLEEFVMDVARFLGFVTPQDFEFLRRDKNDPEAGYYPPPPSLSSLRAAAAARRKGRMNNVDRKESKDGDESENEDSEDENDFGQVEAYRDVKTFWPRLNTFHINYISMNIPGVNDTQALVVGLEQIRSDVEFLFRQSHKSPL